ncbi:hypothetical protein [Marinisporobacter balticus]|uniref:Uncharacterized protein n=1 Tax=Marinisporobacter balticus TaxID=2018667 RepID=A0A4R2KZ08_9FIRM|nr:hypothetical protein EV214_103195 [Marinisporobacter balticus]
MLKPTISRMGGKSRLRKQMIELIPEHTCYCEAFLVLDGFSLERKNQM